MARRDDVAALLQRARAAQGLWAARPLRERVARLRTLARAIAERVDDAVEACRADLGRHPVETLSAELAANVSLCRWWCSTGVRALRPQRVRLPVLEYPGKRAELRRLPVGVVGLITPWNLPIAIPLRTLVPALLAGNAVLWKPSEHTPHASAFVRSLLEPLVPDGLLVVLEGGPEAGAAVASAGCDRLVFTGSVRAGRAVAEAAARTLTPVSLELGGKDAAIVCADCDLERTARGILWAAFFNGGQNCAAIERVYVERAVARPLLDLLVDLARAIRVGPDGELTPLATEAQRQTVRRHLEDARARGARILCGGTFREGGYLEPTILTDLPEDALVMTEESFGPLLPVVAVERAEDAIARANASDYGLNGSVWSRDLARARRLALQLEVGVALVNNHAFTGAVPQLPWSGVKRSGSGVTSSELAFEHLTRPHVLLLDRAREPGDPWWFPYTETARRLLRRAIALGADSALRAVGQLPCLWRLMSRRRRELRGASHPEDRR